MNIRVAVCGDVHMCKNSSIVRGRGERYSQRLENCIKSIEWFERLSKDNGCAITVYLGDFFDSAMLDDETITAVNDISFNEDTQHYFIVGNHESSVNGLYYNSASVLGRIKNSSVVSQLMEYRWDNVAFDFIPYILESDRKPLSEYVPNDNFKHIVFSHNDIAGLQMGKFVSKTGFEIGEIEDRCTLYINGHIHNFSEIGRCITNLGILTGQNFGEDAFKYNHYVMILDIDTVAGTICCDYYTNPHAFNFYKLEIKDWFDLEKYECLKWKPNGVVSIKCVDSLVDKVKEFLRVRGVVEYRMTILSDQTTQNQEIPQELNKESIDYLKKFVEASIEKFGYSDILQEELEGVVNIREY